ncbi:MAG TPA: hypothetical protein VIC30_08310, partial [Orrella sp.]
MNTPTPNTATHARKPLKRFVAVALLTTSPFYIPAKVLAADIRLYGGADVGVSYVHTSTNNQSASRLGMDSSVLDDSMIGL